MATVYKICGDQEWLACVRDGSLPWSAADARDGFVHLSTDVQLGETARRHFAGRTDLWLLAVEVERLGTELRWEPSRDGALFPHLYGALKHTAVVEAAALAVLGPGALAWPPWLPWSGQPAAGGSDSAFKPEAPAKP